MNYIKMQTILPLVFFIFSNLFSCVTKEEAPIEIDREFHLMGYMTGYVGIGGEIDGIRNPVIRVLKGETVRITMINGENMTHDIIIEGTGDQSLTINEEGDSTTVVFQSKGDDIYYCSIPGHRATMQGKIMVVDPMIVSTKSEGLIPMIDSINLNFDFEYNTLEDWTATGDAFKSQPSSDRDQDIYEKELMADLNITGQYFVSSGGTKNYTDTGTLVSKSFKVTHPFAAFKVGGGAMKETRVELVDSDSQEVIFKITGYNKAWYEITQNSSAKLRPVIVDLSDKIGENIFIRLIDREDGRSPIAYIPGNIWAHISFDDFRFYDSRPFFIDELHSDDIIVLPPLDVLPHSGLSGEDAVSAMELPENFTIQLAASEPDVVRPIASAMDYRGRLWVVEGRTYPVKAPDGKGEDRILIFEDTNGDGIFNNRIVFYEGLNLVSGIELGHGGVWIGAAPELLFIPIDKSGSKPAGKPEVLLDGWGYQDTHETLNSFTWGPDGWLYGDHGIFTHSLVGKPGTSEKDRIPINAGVWRFHPITHEFEIFAWGTSNPWGLDFNKYGHAFIAVCVIPHLYHVIQGGRYQRQAGQHFNPYIYDDIKTIADHVHWAGDSGPHAGNFRSGAVGGGHAHSGGTIYQGADHWPEEMRNTILMNNIHGARTNADILIRDGSGYTAMHGADFVITNDFWSQWMDYQYGPGGSLYVIDWYDKNQCHSPNPDVHDKTLGRIFKISHKDDQFIKIDLTQKTSAKLVGYQLHSNEWYVRQSRLLLQERGGSPEIYAALKKILNENPDVTRKLRALWTLHVTGGLKEGDLIALMDNEDEYMRSWAIQLLAEDRNLSSEALDKLTVMAKEDGSALVRLYISSALQRIAPESRWKALAGLCSHKEDFDDHNLPLMNWYAFEALIDLDMEQAVKMAMDAEQGLLLRFTIKKIGSMDSDKAREVLKKINQEWKDRYDEHQNHKIHEELELLLNPVY